MAKKGIKINMNVSEVASLFILLPVLLLVAAYLYTSKYFGHFGIEVSDFFVVSDYLSVAIQNIHAALIPCLIMLFLGLLMWRFNADDEEQDPRILLKILLLVAFVIVWTVIGFIFADPYIKNLNFAFYVTFFFLLSLFFIKVFAYTSQLIPTFIISILVGVFLISIYMSASESIERVYKDIDKTGCTTTIGNYIKVESTIDSCDYALMGINSGYIFLIHKEEDKTLTLNKEAGWFYEGVFNKRNNDYWPFFFATREWLRNYFGIDDRGS